MKPYTFNAPAITFKREGWKDLPATLAPFGTTGMLVTGQSFASALGIREELLGGLESEGTRVIEITRKGGEPTTDEADALAARARAEGIAWVLAIGGGSVLDAGKAAAALATNGGGAARYQEGPVLSVPGIPFVAVPTTAGTGSEVTSNAVLINPARGVKLSIRGPGMLARKAILDPVLTASAGKRVTAHAGMDALVQAIESLVSVASNPLTDMLALEAIRHIWHALPRAFEDGSDLDARERVLHGSLLSALSFANGKLGAVHGFAHPIGARLGLPHGLACGVLLPHVMRFNLDGGITDVTRKYAMTCRIMDGDIACDDIDDILLATRAIEHVVALQARLGIPARLGDTGMTVGDIDPVVQDTKGSSLDANPRSTTKESLAGILRGAL